MFFNWFWPLSYASILSFISVHGRFTKSFFSLLFHCSHLHKWLLSQIPNNRVDVYLIFSNNFVWKNLDKFNFSRNFHTKTNRQKFQREKNWTPQKRLKWLAKLPLKSRVHTCEYKHKAISWNQKQYVKHECRMTVVCSARNFSFPLSPRLSLFSTPLLQWKKEERRKKTVICWCYCFRACQLNVCVLFFRCCCWLLCSQSNEWIWEAINL